MPALFACLLSATLRGDGAERTPEFARDVLPILQVACIRCHGAKNREGNLDLRTRDNLLRGGESGSTLIPGKPAESVLLKKVVSGEMPPGESRLSAEQTLLLRRWIETGALVRGEDADAARRKAAALAVTEADVLVNVFHSHCTACHGKWRTEAGLDLRTRDSILKGGKSGPAIIPGRPDGSLVLKRIVADEMPPKANIFGDSRYVIRVPVPAIEKLRAWIARGAPAAEPGHVADIPAGGPEQDPRIDRTKLDHWAFHPPIMPEVPEVEHAARVQNPIDAFLIRRLEEKGLSFSPEADRLMLLRRATFALTGLAPEPAEVATVLEDIRPDWYERLVDRLLDSRHYGERQAVFWLDAAGYADTHGQINRDELRKYLWRYRDYVIRSFNDDKPYDRFLLEQVAGDELFDYRAAKTLSHKQLDALIATGFLRTASDGTDEGALNKVPNRHAVIDEQIDIFSTAVMGLTLECCRCHSHKFDPIPQRDYYRFAAIFRAAYDPYDWRIPNDVLYPPRFPVEDRYQRYVTHRADHETLEASRFNAPIRAEVKKLQHRKDHISRSAVRRRLSNLPSVVAQYRFDREDGRQVRDSISGTAHGHTTGVYSRNVPKSHGHEWCIDLREGGSVIITGVPFPLHGQTVIAGDAAIDFFVQPMTETGHYGSILWTADAATGDRNRFNIALHTFAEYAGLGGDFRSPDRTLHRMSTATHRMARSEWTHVAIVRRNLDAGRFRFEWYFNGKLDGTQTQDVTGTLPDSPAWTIGGRPGFHVPMRIDEVRLWKGSVQPEHLKRTESLPTSAQARALLVAFDLEEAQRTEKQKRLLKQFAQLTAVTAESIPEELSDAISRAQSQLLNPMRIHALTDTGGKPTPVFVLRRGEIHAPGQRVEPGVPVALTRGIAPYSVTPPDYSTRTSGRRLALARWLTQPDHPLTARVFVNRVWQQHFGRGLVTTTGNFGRKGTRPSHPQLLDWLATRFVEDGWSIKSLQRLIMTSAAWRQQSLYDQSRHAADPDNVLLSRFPFRRLDAEAIRDSLLQVAGQLDRTQFGPAVEITRTEDGEFTVTKSKNGFRRSVYVIRRRLKPVTMLELFDAPAMVPSCVARSESTVATQALQLYNSSLVRGCSERLAQRVIENGVDKKTTAAVKTPAVVQRLYLIALGRRPTSRELVRDTEAIAELERRWRAHLLQQPGTVQNHARQKAIATYCHTLLNSPEFLYVD